ncbi:hypothetical protein GCM10009841_31820 [Microlunatus panaciterrae]|uniref:AraC family L-rhamnose operon transcriptional activator RhaR n=1 Tax=Microlunatus panaciterrae TaxID=400768 RepID=A0ABS2RFR2_9ACTN|nr:AraC family transcriptional regulator [Microlunatus panaciterrae]MBM7797840.1 AraC family L-rhamnose operon transcriptional activator RhaR [Microlunatus panaciterrae]
MDKFTRTEVFGAAGYPVAADRYRVDGEVPTHSHDFLELAVLGSGAAVHVTRAGRQQLKPGTVLVMRPGAWHGYTDCVRADIINVYLGPELLRRELIWLLDFPDLARFLLQGGTSVDQLGADALARTVGWLAELQRRPAEPGAASVIVALGLLGCALGELAGLTFSSGRHAAAISPIVRRAIQLMTDDPAAAWSMPVLATQLNVSVSHLHRRFTAQLGASPMAWLAKVRAELAAVLLIQTDRTVTDIGQRVGWPDANYASRRFRQAYGISPTSYRARFRASV